MKPLLLPILIFSVSFASIGTPEIRAGEAVFSRSGDTVYLLDRNSSPGVLDRLDLNRKTLESVTVPGLVSGESIESLARSNAGFILCLTDSTLYAWDHEKGAAAVKVCRAPEKAHFREVAYSPKDSTIALVCRIEGESSDAEWTLFARFKGEEELQRVNCRRVDAISGMAFDESGDLYFGTEGDLWRGRIVREGGDFGNYLQAYRHAPLATRETNLGNSGQMGASLVEIGEGWIYLHVRRMGGSGWGNVVRIERPPKQPNAEAWEAEMPFELRERVDLYLRALATVEVLGENGVRSYLCTSPNRKKVYFQAYREGERKMGHWLVVEDGVPESVQVSAED